MKTIVIYVLGAAVIALFMFGKVNEVYAEIVEPVPISEPASEELAQVPNEIYQIDGLEGYYLKNQDGIFTKTDFIFDNKTSQVTVNNASFKVELIKIETIDRSLIMILIWFAIIWAVGSVIDTALQRDGSKTKSIPNALVFSGFLAIVVALIILIN